MLDAVLEGAKPEEVEALSNIIRDGKRPSLTLALKLRAKGWIDMVDGVYLLTLTGPTLVDAR